MRYIWNMFAVSVCRQLRSVRTWIMVFLLPAMTLAMLALMPANEVAAPVRVGVSFPAEGAQSFRQALEKRSGAVVSFIPAREEEILGKVYTGQWDCGVIVPEDFEEKVLSGQTDKLITLYTAKGSAVYPLVAESVSACVLQCASPVIAQRFLEEYGLEAQELVQVMPVEVEMETADGRALASVEISQNATGRIIRGVLAIALLVWMLLAAVDLGLWLQSPAARRFVPVAGVAVVILAKVAAAALPAVASSAVCLWLLGAAEQLPALLLYVAALCAVMILCALVKKLWSALPVLIPFVPVINLLVSPVIFDPAEHSLLWRCISPWMPASLFLRGCEGVTYAWITMAAAATVGPLLCLAAEAAAKRKPRKK